MKSIKNKPLNAKEKSVNITEMDPFLGRKIVGSKAIEKFRRTHFKSPHTAALLRFSESDLGCHRVPVVCTYIIGFLCFTQRRL